MFVQGIYQSNLDYLFDTIKRKFMEGDDYNKLEPSNHVLNLFNRVSVYIHLSDLSYLDVFYLKQYIPSQMVLREDSQKTIKNEYQIGQFDTTSIFGGIGFKKRFKTIIHLTGNSLFTIMGGRPYNFYSMFFNEMKITKPLKEDLSPNFTEEMLLKYIFQKFLDGYFRMIRQFISETDYLVDAKIFSDYYSDLNQKSTDVKFRFFDCPDGIYSMEQSREKIQSLCAKYSEESNFVFSINSSLATFMLFTNNILNHRELLDYKDFKLVSNSEIVSWMQTLLSSYPNRSKVYQSMAIMKENFEASLKDPKTTLNRYSFILGGNPISYTIKLTMNELDRISREIESLDPRPIENSELKIISGKIRSILSKI